jgi:hypothetical protein
MIWYVFIDVDEAKADYKSSSLVEKLLNSYADGVNFTFINTLK